MVFLWEKGRPSLSVVVVVHKIILDANTYDQEEWEHVEHA